MRSAKAEEHIRELTMEDRDTQTDEPKTFAEYALVRLARPVRGVGVVYPAGTIGVIVDRHEDGLGYEVEFDSPKPGVATAPWSSMQRVALRQLPPTGQK